jgi:hypothetical protein
MAVNKEMRICFSCKKLLIVGSRDKDVPVAKFKTFVIRPPFYHCEQKLYPVIFERVVCKADDLPIGGSSIGDTVFLCELCLDMQGKGFRKNMAVIFMAELRSRSVDLTVELFNSNIISVGPSSATRLKELKTESLAGILGVLQRERKDEIVPELIFALFESGVIIFDVRAKETFEILEHECAESITTRLAVLLSDMRNILPSPEIENLIPKLASLEVFLTTSDD